MSISRMMAEKMNLDLRDMILQALEGIYLLKKSDKKMQREGHTYLEEVKESLSKLKSRHVMLDSLYQFYRVKPDFSNALKVCIKGINNRNRQVEGKLSLLLFELEDKFDKRLARGLGAFFLINFRIWGKLEYNHE